VRSGESQAPEHGAIHERSESKAQRPATRDKEGYRNMVFVVVIRLGVVVVVYHVAGAHGFVPLPILNLGGLELVVPVSLVEEVKLEVVE